MYSKSKFEIFTSFILNYEAFSTFYLLIIQLINNNTIENFQFHQSLKYFEQFLDPRERLFRPAGKSESNRGFTGVQSKVAQIRTTRHIPGTGSESNLLEGLSYKFDDPIHKSKSEWVLVPHDEARPSKNKRKKNNFSRNEPIYATPSLPSIVNVENNYDIVDEQHYYSIPSEQIQETPVSVRGKTENLIIIKFLFIHGLFQRPIITSDKKFPSFCMCNLLQ